MILGKEVRESLVVTTPAKGGADDRVVPLLFPMARSPFRNDDVCLAAAVSCQLRICFRDGAGNAGSAHGFHKNLNLGDFLKLDQFVLYKA
jgi:hypothetical protein